MMQKSDDRFSQNWGIIAHMKVPTQKEFALALLSFCRTRAFIQISNQRNAFQKLEKH